MTAKTNDEKPVETEPVPVVVALSRVMEDVRAVAKNDRNNDQNYSFRGVDAVMNAVGPALRAHGVVIMPMCEQANYRDVLTSRGKPSRECTVTVRYRFYGPKGDYIEAVTPGESMDFGDKGAPKAMSVAYRTVLLQALCLPTHEPEPDAAAYERAPQPAREERVELSPADMARAKLIELAETNKWDVIAVRKAFAAQYKYPLREATDPNVITAFGKLLPDLMAQAAAAVEPEKVPAAASNGAAQ